MQETTSTPARRRNPLAAVGRFILNCGAALVVIVIVILMNVCGRRSP